jgi:hypothetical protein
MVEILQLRDLLNYVDKIIPLTLLGKNRVNMNEIGKSGVGD